MARVDLSDRECTSDADDTDTRAVKPTAVPIMKRNNVTSSPQDAGALGSVVGMMSEFGPRSIAMLIDMAREVGAAETEKAQRAFKKIAKAKPEKPKGA